MIVFGYQMQPSDFTEKIKSRIESNNIKVFDSPDGESIIVGTLLNDMATNNHVSLRDLCSRQPTLEEVSAVSKLGFPFHIPDFHLVGGNFRFIDLFAGLGGFRYAMESVHGRCVFSSDRCPQVQDAYEWNFGERPSGDITKIHERDIPYHHVLCAGFPCQPFSISGKQKGFEDTRGTAFFEILRIAKHHMPRVIFMENVRNLARHDEGRTLDIMLSALDEIGYDVNYKVLNASNFGVPTSRERIYFVCFRKDLNVTDYSFPEETKEIVTVEDMLDEGLVSDFYTINRDDVAIDNAKLMSLKLNPPAPYKPIRVGTIGKGAQGYRIYSVKGHAITFSSEGGGIAAKTGAYLMNDGTIRKLTPNECARIMGFPNSFSFPEGGYGHRAYKQIGNSVTVPVLQRITRSFERYLYKNNNNEQKQTFDREGQTNRKGRF